MALAGMEGEVVGDADCLDLADEAQGVGEMDVVVARAMEERRPYGPAAKCTGYSITDP
jgi:hypothetical protein